MKITPAAFVNTQSYFISVTRQKIYKKTWNSATRFLSAIALVLLIVALTIIKYYHNLTFQPIDKYTHMSTTTTKNNTTTYSRSRRQSHFERSSSDASFLSNLSPNTEIKPFLGSHPATQSIRKDISKASKNVTNFH